MPGFCKSENVASFSNSCVTNQSTVGSGSCGGCPRRSDIAVAGSRVHGRDWDKNSMGNTAAATEDGAESCRCGAKRDGCVAKKGGYGKERGDCGSAVGRGFETEAKKTEE